MQVLVTPRRAGKTNAAVAWVKQGRPVPWYPFWDRILVVPDYVDAQRLRRYPLEFGLDYRQVFTYRELREGRFPMLHTGEMQVMFDDLDRALSQILGFRPTAATLTGVPLALCPENMSKVFTKNGES